MAQLIHGLSARHDVAAVYLRSDTEAPIDERLGAALSRVEEVRHPHRLSMAERLRRHTATVRGVPAWAAFADVAEFARRTADVARDWRPEIVHFEYHVMGQYARAIPDRAARRILSEYEAGVLAAREHMATDRDGRTLGPALQRRAWEQFERRVIADMDAVVVFSERDQAALAPVAGTTPIVRIGIGTRLPSAPLDPLGSRDRPQVLFVGNFMHPPNVDAAERLVSHIFPLVKRQVASAQLRIVGPNPPSALVASAQDGIEITGEVPDIVPWMSDASLIVVPLRLGAGMRVKVLEALAYGKAVVASPRAIEGLTVTDGVHLSIAETDAEFAARIVALLASPDERAALARSARDWACANLGERRWMDEYDALYDSLSAEPRAPQ